MRAKIYSNEIVLVIATMGIILFMIAFNDICKYIRIKEIKIFLQKSTYTDNNLDHVGLVMKYKLHKKLYENQISEDNADLTEMKINALVSDTATKKKVSLEKYNLLATPVISTINFFRFILGKSPIVDIEEDMSTINLDIAYYYERNNYYNKALKIYNKALEEENYDRVRKASILLHKGFCQAIIGNYDKARKNYLTIIEDYGDLGVAITAAILLRYLEGFRSEIEKILKSERNSIEKSEKLQNLIAYKEALEVLKDIEKKASWVNRSKLQFIKARCLEEIAEKEKAINIYQKIIEDDSRSKYAKLANRRIYIIGSQAHNGDKVKQLALKNNQLLDDKAFTKMIDDTSSLSRTSSFNEKLKNNVKFRNKFNKIRREFPIHSYDKMKNIDIAIKRIDDKIKQQKSNTDGTPVKVKIFTVDGNVFIGVITAVTNDYINLSTNIGLIKIEKNRIIKREKL